MNKQADKTSENNNQTIANSLPKLKSSGESAFQLEDNRPETIAQRKLQEAINDSSRVKQLKVYQEMADNSPQVKQPGSYQAAVNSASSITQRKENIEEESVQGKFEPVQKKENTTGLPGNLKSGVESLSGVSMDHVNVHYNSGKPAQLQAHAYAQGSEIHVAPGQEQHLPHEAWHVVQQAQGRVKPTLQMKNDVAVNDDIGLEQEADVMGAKALGQGEMQNSTVALQKKSISDTSLIRQNKVVQLAREYDETLSPHKTKMMQWLVETNQTLGMSQDGKSDPAANKKSNFSWHHILPFAELSEHGEGKTAPANHGGNLRLGPMKNRFEAGDVGGGTAVDYGYLPLVGGNIVLDPYSKGVFDGTIKSSDKSSLTGAGKLSSETSKSTPQAENFTEGKQAGVFGEWFLDAQLKNTLLSKGAIAGKLVGAEEGDISLFVQKIDAQFDSLLRTYKYYNKKKIVQTTSGVPMTDISEGKFGHITVKKKLETIKASTIIDQLLRSEKWITRGSQGEIQNATTTYKFGLASYPAFTTLVEAAVKDIDLADYKNAKLLEFKEELETAFSNFRATGKEKSSKEDSDEGSFDQEKETTLIESLVENMKTGSDTYDALWAGIEEGAIEDQYVKVKMEDDDKNWAFPEPDAETRKNAIIDTETESDTHSEAYEAWIQTFVAKLSDWDGEVPLFDEDTNPEDNTYIDFDDVAQSIDDNEKTWKWTEINSDRQEKSNRALPKDFIPKNMTEASVKNEIGKYLSENSVQYLSSRKVDLTLDDVQEALKDKILPHYNVFSKRLKGVDKDLAKRKIAFGANLDGFVNSTKWNVINSSEIPAGIEGTEGKKWAELGDLQKTLYDKWIESGAVAGFLAGAATSEKLAKTLP